MLQVFQKEKLKFFQTSHKLLLDKLEVQNFITILIIEALCHPAGDEEI